MTIRKRIIAVVATTVVLLTMVVVPTFAGFSLDSSGTSTSYEVIHPFAYPRHYSSTYVTDQGLCAVSVDLDASVFTDTNFTSGHASDRITYEIYNENNQGYQTLDFHYTYTEDNLVLKLYGDTSSMVDIMDSTTWKQRFDIISYENDYIFIEYADLQKLLLKPSVFSEGDETMTTSYKYMIEGMYSYSQETASGETWQYQTFRYSNMSSAQDILNALQNDRELSYRTDVGDVIAISRLYVETSTYIESNPDGHFNGCTNIICPMETVNELSNKLSLRDFVQDNPFSGTIGTTTTVTEYVDEINIASIVQSVADTLNVDIIGPISPMDILGIVIAIGLTIWLLKVFAGG